MAGSLTGDQQLAAFLAIDDDVAAERALGDLIEQHATPLIRRVVWQRLSSAPNDIDDVGSVVTLQLMVRLRRERESGASTIEAFQNYVAASAHHGCDHFLRSRYPLRWRLRNRIRHVLEHDARFAIWKLADVWLCGLAAWRGRAAANEIRIPAGLSSVPVDAVAILLLRLFAGGTPLELTMVVDTAATAWGIPLFEHDDSAVLDAVADREPRVDHILDQQVRLGAVWTHLRELPLRQRHALLLNLRDDAITLFVTSGVVTLRGLAEVLELGVHEFAALWKELPLPDNAIAERLGCTRQQVINLRMAARKRLANRLSLRANIGGSRSL